MERKEAEQKNIKIYWWNMGTKTLDFDGKIKDFLIKKDIKVRRITTKRGKHVSKGYRFRICLATSVITLDTFNSDYILCVNESIKTFLSLLGDKHIYHSPYGDYRINWR